MYHSRGGNIANKFSTAVWRGRAHCGNVRNHFLARSWTIFGIFGDEGVFEEVLVVAGEGVTERVLEEGQVDVEIRFEAIHKAS